MFAQRIERLTSSLVRDILAATQLPGMISFAGGLPAPELLESPSLFAVPPRAGQYGMSEGEPELCEAIAAEVRSLGLACDASQVLVLSGSQQGLDLAAKLFIEPGTPVAVEAPTYVAALQVFRLFGAKCMGVPLGREGLDPERLGSLVRAHWPAFAYLVPTFQNPSGVCYSSTTREGIAEVLDAGSIPLLEDEPYRDLAYAPVDRTPIAAHLQRAPWIYQGSFSKTFLPGARIGFLIASPDLYPHLLRLKQAADLHTNRLGQWAALSWLRDAGRAKKLQALRLCYAAKRDNMDEALQRHFGDLASWRRPDGGLFFWVRLHAAVDTRRLLQPCLARGVAFMPGEEFFPRDELLLGHLRLNFSCPSPEQMTKGLEVLAEVVQGQRQRPACR